MRKFLRVACAKCWWIISTLVGICVACGGNISGASSQTAYQSAEESSIKKQFGNDKEQLKQNSPRRRTDEIKIPILIVHGENDLVVPVEQSRLMADALKENNKTFKYVELKSGTHYLADERNRIRLFQEMDLFLASYL